MWSWCQNMATFTELCKYKFTFPVQTNKKMLKIRLNHPENILSGTSYLKRTLSIKVEVLHLFSFVFAGSNKAIWHTVKYLSTLNKWFHTSPKCSFKFRMTIHITLHCNTYGESKHQTIPYSKWTSILLINLLLFENCLV